MGLFVPVKKKAIFENNLRQGYLLIVPVSFSVCVVDIASYVADIIAVIFTTKTFSTTRVKNFRSGSFSKSEKLSSSSSSSGIENETKELYQSMVSMLQCSCKFLAQTFEANQSLKTKSRDVSIKLYSS